MNKRRLKDHFFHFWILYLVGALIPIAFWNWLFTAKVQPKDEEKVVIFVGAKTVDKVDLQDKIKGLGDESLLEVEVLDYDPADKFFGTYLSSAGKISSDFFLLPSGSFTDSMAQSVFAHFDKGVLATKLSTSNTIYSLGEYEYGISLKGSGTELLSSYMSYDDETSDDYYLFFNRNSINFKGFLTEKEGKSTHALEAVISLFEGKI